jgi:5-methylcytosine-specific restriction enzyme subunit McrC
MAIKEINLFEFQKYTWDDLFQLLDLIHNDIQASFKIHFEEVIQIIWVDRYRHIPSDILYNPSESQDQRFFEVTNLFIKPRNYTGSIEFSFNSNYYRINIFPKIFYLPQFNYTQENYLSIQYHVLWWLSEVTDILPPNYQQSISEIDNGNILDIYITLFSSFTLNILENDVYRYYNSVNDHIQTVKGQINFSKYLNNFSQGNQHIINCDFDDFNIDNNFNQIIKYVCHLLKAYSNNKRVLQNLNDILFILDEVSYLEIDATDCDKVILNPIFTEYKVILDYCRLFLNGTNSYNQHHDYDVFALIIPTEKLFEKLIRKFCSEITHDNFRELTTQRPGRNYLTKEILSNGSTENRFKLINDIIIKTTSGHIIIDTKYKILHELSKDNGIKQSDMYQMVSYAISSRVNTIKLVYPAKLKEDSKILAKYEVEDMLAENKKISINALVINIIHKDNLQINLNHNFYDLFNSTKKNIVSDLEILLSFEKIIPYISHYKDAIAYAAEQKSEYN